MLHSTSSSRIRGISMEQKSKPPMMDELHQVIKYHIEHVDEIAERFDRDFLSKLPKGKYTYVEIIQAILTETYKHAVMQGGC
jgi:hypothetical protein